MKFGYVSTRGGVKPAPFSMSAREGLCKDGGLYIPTFFPVVEPETLKQWESISYLDLAFEIISRLAPELQPAELKKILAIAYGPSSFGVGELAPLRAIGNSTYLLNLATGPTYAFKDYAMQFVAAFLDNELAKSKSVLNILGATAGDTGSAAIAAFMRKPNIRVFMLSPCNGMSDVQKAQMYGIDDPNVFNFAVDGVFDDCQNLVKAINADQGFRSEFHLGAVNSINWARIAAQIVYYFWAYLSLPDKGAGPLSISVPSGNFGNAYACYAARRMGLPIDQIIVATNENDVLCQFLNMSAYVPRPSSGIVQTSSPSMDIGKASNIERLVYEFTGRHSSHVRDLWQKLDTGKDGFILIGADDQFRKESIHAGRCDHAERLTTIRNVFDISGRIVDPHTAVAVKVGNQLKLPDHQLICVETAAALKFPDTVFEAIGKKSEIPPDVQALLEKRRNVIPLSNSVQSLRQLIERHAIK